MSAFAACGQAIWNAYNGDQLNASSQALVREYARAADVLDRLNDLATGRKDAWVTITFDDMGEVQLNIDRILETQVKVQGMLKQLHGELRMAGIKPGAAVNVPRAETPRDMIAEARERKAERERQSG